MYLTFFFWGTNTFNSNMSFLVLESFNLSQRRLSSWLWTNWNKVWRSSKQSYQKAWVTFPRVPSYDDIKCGLSPILGKKSSSCRWGISPTINCVEGYLLCLLHSGWVQESGPCFTFNSCPRYLFSNWPWDTILTHFAWGEWFQSPYQDVVRSF